MSISYYQCDNCQRGYADCYGEFCECGAGFCSEKCADYQPYGDDEKSCASCRGEVFTDTNLLNTLLKHYNLTRNDVEKMAELHHDKNHEWGMGWEDSDLPHPGFGGSTNIYGSYVSQCEKCGMYGYEFRSLTAQPGKYEGQPCSGKKIR